MPQVVLSCRTEYACCSACRSSLSIVSMASIARFDAAASVPPSIEPSVFGTICHDSPNLSFSQPHRLGTPPVGGDGCPQLVDFLLSIARDEERHGFRECVHRAGIQRHEPLALELELRRYDLPLRPIHGDDLRPLENRGVEQHGIYQQPRLD